MTTTTATLKTGECLTVRVARPPLGEYAPLVGCWGAIRDELLVGGMSESLATPYFIGELNGQVVGSMACYVPVDTMDVGLVEFVATSEEHRQKGIASALLGTLVEWFASAGQRAAGEGSVTRVRDLQLFQGIVLDDGPAGAGVLLNPRGNGSFDAEFHDAAGRVCARAVVETGTREGPPAARSSEELTCRTCLFACGGRLAPVLRTSGAPVLFAL